MNLLEQADKIDAALAILMKREDLFVGDKEFQEAKKNLNEAIASLKNYKIVNKELNNKH